MRVHLSDKGLEEKRTREVFPDWKISPEMETHFRTLKVSGGDKVRTGWPAALLLYRSSLKQK